MGRKCVIKTCSNSEAQKRQGLLQHVTFHRFPSDIARRDNWVVHIQVLANQFRTIHEAAVICSEHFDEISYVSKPNGTIVLSHTAVPTLFRTVRQSFSEIEMISSDSDSKKENYVGKLQLRCDKEILSVTGHRLKPNFQNQEIDGIDAGSLQQSCDEVIQSESVRKPIAWSLQQGCAKTNSSELTHTTICEENDANNLVPMKETDIEHQLKWPRRIRYPGDISDIQSMSRRELEKSVILCKQKIEDQSKIIAALKRKVRAKDLQISTLRSVKKKLALIDVDRFGQ